MIRRSDNVAATRVRDIVGNAAVVRLAHRVGMTRFRVAQVWGLSQITARDQTKFFLHIDASCRSATATTRAAAADDRAVAALGLRAGDPATAGRSSSRAAGDRAPAPWITRSGCCSAERTASRSRSSPSDSPSHDYGKATLRGVAKRLLRGLDQTSR